MYTITQELKKVATYNTQTHHNMALVVKCYYIFSISCLQGLREIEPRSIWGVYQVTVQSNSSTSLTLTSFIYNVTFLPMHQNTTKNKQPKTTTTKTEYVANKSWCKRERVLYIVMVTETVNMLASFPGSYMWAWEWKKCKANNYNMFL